MGKLRFYDVLDTNKLGKRVFEFAEHYENIEPEINKLRSLEDRYDFFRIKNPVINYNGQIMDFSVDQNIYLDAAWNGASIHLGLDQAHANTRILSNLKKKTLEIQARELMQCDPNTAYQYVKRHFENHGHIEDKIIYSIKIKNDLLIFEDDETHSIFLGQTGGYDPSYIGSLDPANREYIMRKNKWTGAGFYSLEKRIKSLKDLFDNLVDFAQLEPVSREMPKVELPDYKMIYARLVDSKYYHDMLKFGKKLSKKFNLSEKYDMTIAIRDGEKPDISMINEDDMTKFKMTFCDVYGWIGTCELHMPKKYSRKKTFDKRINTYAHHDNVLIHTHNHNKDDSEKIIQITEFLKTTEDVPESLEKCLEDLR